MGVSYQWVLTLPRGVLILPKGEFTKGAYNSWGGEGAYPFYLGGLVFLDRGDIFPRGLLTLPIRGVLILPNRVLTLPGGCFPGGTYPP